MHGSQANMASTHFCGAISAAAARPTAVCGSAVYDFSERKCFLMVSRVYTCPSAQAMVPNAVTLTCSSDIRSATKSFLANSSAATGTSTLPSVFTSDIQCASVADAFARFSSSVAPSALSDSLGRFNILVPCAFLTGLSMLVFWPFATNLVAIMLFAAVYGFFSGAFNALIIPCIVQISDIREIGTRVGILYSIISFP